jgi:hypothetical protein
VAVTGIGVISPLGNDSGEFFDNLARGRSGIVRLPAPALAHAGKPVLANPRTHIGGAVSFDGASFFPAPRLRMLDRVSQFALAATAQAVCDADLTFDHADRRRAGVFVGTGMGGAQTTDDGYFTLYAEGSDRVKPYSVLMAMTNAAASWIGIEYGLTGPNLTYSTACSSSAVAIGEAARRIAAGDADVCVVAGGEALDTVRRLKKAGERPAWSYRDPERKPFPFEAPFHPAEIAHEVFQAYTTFALWDVARRAHHGAGVDAYRRGLGDLFAPMTAVAAARLAQRSISRMSLKGSSTSDRNCSINAMRTSCAYKPITRVMKHATYHCQGHFRVARSVLESPVLCLQLPYPRCSTRHTGALVNADEPAVLEGLRRAPRGQVVVRQGFDEVELISEFLRQRLC